MNIVVGRPSVRYDFPRVSKLSSIPEEERNSVPEAFHSTLDYLTVKLFQIDIVQFVRLGAVLAKEYHLPPGSLDSLPFWEYELWLEELNQVVKEANEDQKAVMTKSQQEQKMPKMTMPKMGMPAAPQIPNINVNMPKI